MTSDRRTSNEFPTAALYAQAHASKKPTFIPVYAIDGVTQVGVYEIGPAGG